ncbi:Pycsar system effector family protein [Amycolatopsis sp. NEAU-NG30]|uniref:Pycsar system effector family protein n=1 Tax=Amycolatopsis melonis TaxID=3156488 RepID=A0ABV0LTI8_9PSEU
MKNTRTTVPVRSASGLARTDAELGTSLTTISFFQNAVQQADEKARTVVAVQTMVTAMVAAQLGVLGTPHAASVPRPVLVVVVLCFALAYGYSVFHLVQAIRPRTSPPPGDNRFAFPAVAAGTGCSLRQSVREQCAQAYDLARLLAALAMRKHRHLRFALAGTCALFASGLGLLVITALS